MKKCNTFYGFTVVFFCTSAYLQRYRRVKFCLTRRDFYLFVVFLGDSTYRGSCERKHKHIIIRKHIHQNQTAKTSIHLFFYFYLQRTCLIILYHYMGNFIRRQIDDNCLIFPALILHKNLCKLSSKRQFA